MGLMTERFGSEATKKGGVYVDLFRSSNLNRQSGNKESLWVFQYDYLNAVFSTTDKRAREIIPFYQNIQITAEKEEGLPVKTTVFLGVTDMKRVRGIGWMQLTTYFFNELWEGDYDNDIRNSEYNMVKDGYSSQIDPIRYWYLIITKFSSIGKVPELLYVKDANGDGIWKTSAIKECGPII
ncbi:hypothetical protein [Dysgonomonas sp. Marseille-P4677]|uniref:hypothetical protein n=1 Tax=Dysgonomonas sp. Marseille-P4677 TaxID=2364790 RepID=UPI001F2F4419|nr:hypothetical protein [Dysgonomonas sp. Marseille-P4677]